MNSSGFGVAVYAVCNAPFGSEVQIDAITLTVYYNNAGPSNYLKSVGYAFAVPAGATVQGVVVEAEAKTDALTTPATLYGKLVVGGAVQTTARSIAVPTAEGYVALGSPTDLWGTTLTAAQLNAADFGVVLYVDGTEGQTVSVDHIRITVYYDNPTPTPTPTITPTATPSGVMVRSAWTADDTGETKSTFNPGETVRYYGELYNGTGITQTVSNQWQAWGACGWILNQATNESVRPTTNQWYIAAPLPTGNCGGVYTYTLGVTYNSITSTQLVTFSVTGPTPTPPPTGVEQVAIDYSYDPLYRLTRATYSGSLAASYAYRYDAVGNRLTQDANGTRTTYSYDNANRLTSVNGQAYTWDNNGNLTSDGLLTYSYDQANRLKQVTQGANTYTFAYNGIGDRLSQTVGITTTRYVLDPAAGLTQVLADGTNTYVYGNGRIAQYQAEMQYFGPDALGSVRQIYDASGQVLATNRYDPYGGSMSHYGDATSVFGFTGEQWDAATGLEYLRARYYSPAQGRFVTHDVWAGDLTSPMSYNGWSYVNANPVNGIDPSGQCTGIAPWTDFLGGALNAGPGLSGVGGYLDAARAAGQKAAQNCAQNLGMASTRFQQGNYGSSLAYASGLLTSLNEAQGSLAEVNRGDYGTKAWTSFDRQDYGTAALYALRAPQVAQEGLGFWAQWFSDVETATNNRFNRMFLEDPLAFPTLLRWEDLPELMEIAEADCRIGGTGLAIASLLVPGPKGGLSGSLEGPGRFSVPDEFLPASKTGQYLNWAPQVRRFKSFPAFKKAMGSPGIGNVWHHQVEQRKVLVQRFGAQAIHSTENIVAASRQVNQQIADYYSTKTRFSDPLTVRKWLEPQSFKQQLEFGQDILRRVLNGQPLP